jgi:hypothetical protein
MRRRSAPPTATPGIDFAWRVHAALQDWTRSVDQKASIILALSVAIATLAGREVFDANGGLHETSGTKLWLVRIMAISFAASALLASSVVLPRLRRSAARREAHRGLIYFGHLRHRTAADIEQHLHRLDDDETLAQLARQLKTTAAVAWRKHARLQAAMLALLLATTSFATARIFL